LTREEYAAVERIGRGKALVGERDTLWTVFNPLVKKIVNKNAATWGHLCRLTADAIKRGQIDATFDAVIVDESKIVEHRR
jgi:hypothetical protein